ncbi:beta-phosphoglucomutase [Bacillus sp. ISL-47]|uniref:beta-phosphoglucomutase n=1 Tax=Bacillus sp. ISL-47 TaxID=2819130 RepID=UPI002035A544|nr:beta-phosphoglucomutase [Bacillus sp. ISL-47]
MLQAVIFDLDGVIADTFELYYIANKKVADLLGVPFTREDNERFKGIARKEIIESLVHSSGKILTDTEKIKMGDDKNKHYQELIEAMDESAVLPRMKEFIMDLKKHNLKLAIASSSSNGPTVLQKLGLTAYFDCIVDPSSLQKGKPDPGIFLKAADCLQVPYENCAALEDGEAGLTAIKKTKMFSVGIGQALEELKPDWHVMSTEEISYQELLKRFEG